MNAIEAEDVLFGTETGEADSLAAFNAGCDSRLAGRPLSANPHPCGSGSNSLWMMWRRGWKDCNDHWAERPQGRRVQPLPPIRTPPRD